MSADYVLLKQTLIAHLQSADEEISFETKILVEDFLEKDCVTENHFNQFPEFAEATKYIQDLFAERDLNYLELKALQICTDLLTGLSLQAFLKNFKERFETITILENLISLEQILLNRFSSYRAILKLEKLCYALPLRQIV